MDPLSPSQAHPPGRVRGFFRRLSDLPAGTEPIIWIVLIAVTLAIRLYLIHLLPVALWSKDAGSYADSAFKWVHTGVWQTDPRRGPVYSMLIALCGKLWGNITSIMFIQHAMGTVAVLLAILAMRLLHGRRALVPLAACGYAYAVYGLPVYLEHLVRNEITLFFCGSVSLVAWLLAIRNRQPHWLWAVGIFAAILTATKNVWLPFPVLFIAATAWYYRKERRFAVSQILIFCIAFGVPYMGLKVFKHRTLGVDRSDEPQEGVLLYGRTAQFTKLDGGIEPEMKAQIRQQVEDYQKEVFRTDPPKLNNNEILKKTVVPTMTSILRKQGKNGEDLNRMCRALAVEAIKSHPAQYAAQVWRDIVRLNVSGGQRYSAPDNKEAASQRRLLLELDEPDELIHVQDSVAKLDPIIRQTGADPSAVSSDEDDNGPEKGPKKHDAPGPFTPYQGILTSAWLFDFAPALLTSLLLPVIFFLSPVPMRAWWLGSAGLWYFTVVLLSTVGRPLDRYLIPALPVMFFTLTTAIIMAWNALAGNGRENNASRS